MRMGCPVTRASSRGASPLLSPAAAAIVQRRTQMLVHSYLYYALNTSIVSDSTFDRWARELVDLQRQHPAPIHFYDLDFADWDGSTGYHLPQYPWVVDRGQHLLHLHDNPQLRADRAPPAPAAPAAGQMALF